MIQVNFNNTWEYSLRKRWEKASQNFHVSTSINDMILPLERKSLNWTSKALTSKNIFVTIS